MVMFNLSTRRGFREIRQRLQASRHPWRSKWGWRHLLEGAPCGDCCPICNCPTLPLGWVWTSEQDAIIGPSLALYRCPVCFTDWPVWYDPASGAMNRAISPASHAWLRRQHADSWLHPEFIPSHPPKLAWDDTEVLGWVFPDGSAMGYHEYLRELDRQREQLRK